MDSISIINGASRLTADPPGPRVSDTGAWQRIAESLMLGVFHAIGSRVSALSGIARMARMDVSFEETLLPLLESEVSKLAHTMALVTLLPRQPRSTAGPTAVCKLVPRLLDLHRHHPDLEPIEYRCSIRTAGAVVQVDSSELSHALLSVFSLLGWSALRDGYEIVDVEVVKLGSQVVVRAERASASNGRAGSGRVPDDLPGLTEELASAFRLAFGELGAEASARTVGADGLAAFELRLPLLENGGG